MQLNKVQQSFKDHMFAPVEVVEHPEDQFSNLFNVGNIPLDHRLKIYRNHIVTTLSEALVLNFPLIEALTGKGFLTTAAKLYLFDNPPTQACLDHYGESFPEFLEQYDHAKNLPYLSDMACLDWAMNQVRLAKVDATLTIEDLAHIPADGYDQAVFTLKKSVKLIKSKFPIGAIASFCALEQEEQVQETLNVEPKDTFLLIVRQEWEPQLFELPESEFFLFTMLDDGLSLSEAFETVIKQDPEFDLAAFLQQYISCETFSEIMPK